MAALWVLANGCCYRFCSDRVVGGLAAGSHWGWEQHRGCAGWVGADTVVAGGRERGGGWAVVSLDHSLGTSVGDLLRYTTMGLHGVTERNRRIDQRAQLKRCSDCALQLEEHFGEAFKVV